MLGFLMEGATHGYELRRRFVAGLGGLWRISESQMYSILKRLVAKGLVASSTCDNADGPSRHLLSISPSGRDRFEDWLSKPSYCSPRVLRLEFLSRLYFAGTLRELYGPSLQAKIHREQIAEAERELSQAALARSDGDGTIEALGRDFRVNQLRAALSWLETSVDEAIKKR